MIILYAVLSLLALLIAVMALNTLLRRPNRTNSEQTTKTELTLDADKFAKNLSGMIRHKTITSPTPEGIDSEAFLGLHRYLEETYPLIHKAVEKTVIGDYSLLYKWTGTGSENKPFLMMAHMDVVPADERTADKWEHAAFSGDIADGYVWGRGALDMKGQLAAIFESVEHLLAQGYVPHRDIYIAVGHDEESMGKFGAQTIVQHLEDAGVRFDFVIDEGGVVMDGSLMGIKAMVATIGICEKGYADVRLTAESAGGHASRPPRKTAVGALARAITALEKKQMKPALNAPLKEMLLAVGGYMKFPLNVITANLFITRPLLMAGLSAGPTGSAMVRTTTAPTMLTGSSAPNVLAEKAEAVINFRIAPGDTLEKLLAHVRKTVGAGIKIELIQGYDPSHESSTQSEAYEAIKQTVQSLFSGYVVAPYLMVAATDSRWYGRIADNVYLFQPFRSMSEDLGTIHAAGERLSVSSLAEGVEFFIRLVKKADE